MRRAPVIFLLRSAVLLIPAAVVCCAMLGVSGVWLSFVITALNIFFLALPAFLAPGYSA